MAIIKSQTHAMHQVQPPTPPEQEQLQEEPELHAFSVITWRIFAKHAREEFTTLEKFSHTINIGIKAVNSAHSRELKTLIVTDVYKYIYVCCNQLNNCTLKQFCWTALFKGFELLLDIEYQWNMGCINDTTYEKFHKTCVATMYALLQILVEHYSSNELNQNIDQMLVENAKSLNRTSEQKSAMRRLMLTFVR